jgi:cysteine desulfurase
MEPIYLDNNATTRLDPAVLAAMEPYLRDRYGNPSSVHALGRAARAAVRTAREEVAGAIGAAPEDIVFTSGGTEADNLAIFGIARAAGPARRRVVTSSIEHPAVLEAAERLEREGHDVIRLPVDGQGRVRPDDLANALRGDTALVSIMFANNEVGTIQPIRELARIAHARDVPFHTDAVQALGKTPIDVDTLDVDALTLSAHKIHGPVGVGALFLRRGTPFEPTIVGGGQEGGRRPGSENVASIVGMGTAASLARSRLASDPHRVRDLAERFLRKLRATVDGIELNGAPRDRLSNCLNLSFEGVDAEALVVSLDLAGVCVSAGSACSSGTLEISHVLGAMGLSPERARTAIRISLSRDTKWVELDQTISHLERSVTRIRTIGGDAGIPSSPAKISYRFR